MDVLSVDPVARRGHVRIGLLIALAVTIAGSAYLRSKVPPAPAVLYSTMEWHGCPYGSCAPSFHPVPDGSARLLRCDTAGNCVLFSYVYWSAENCNRLTACPDYKPHRGAIRERARAARDARMVSR